MKKSHTFARWSARLEPYMRLMVIFPYLSTLIIGGFGISRLMSGEYGIAAFDFIVAILFFILGTYTFRTGRETAARYLSCLVSLVGAAYFLSQGNPSGIFWVYSSSVVFYYLLPIKHAIPLNVLLLVAAGYFYFLVSESSVHFFSFVATFSLVNVFSISFALLTEKSIRTRLDLEQSQKEVEQLRELLPICASCHMIRDEEDSWHQLESYLTEHRSTRFSHSICPSCAKNFYGEDT